MAFVSDNMLAAVLWQSRGSNVCPEGVSNDLSMRCSRLPFALPVPFSAALAPRGRMAPRYLLPSLPDSVTKTVPPPLLSWQHCTT